MYKKIAIEPQLSTMDCGPSCLKSICAYYGINCSIAQLREWCNTAIDGTSLYGLSNAAKQVGLETKAYKCSINSLISKYESPCIILWNGNHYMVLYGVKGNKKNTIFMCANPAGGKKLKLSLDEFKRGFCSCEGEQGIVIQLKKSNSSSGSQPGLSECVSEGKSLNFLKRIQGTICDHKKNITISILATIAIMLIQFSTPFLAKSIFDKGVSNNNCNIILVILLAQFVLECAQFLFSFTRNYLLLHTGIETNIKIVGNYLKNLLTIKMKYMEANFCGDIIQRINDHYRIQYFLTDNALDSIFAIFTLIIFGIVLCIYSSPIFIIFLIGGLLYISWVLIFMKRREVLDNKIFALNSSHQSIIMQFIHGMAEIRLNSCGKRKIHQWENLQKNLKLSNVENMKLSQWQQSGSIFLNQAKNLLITAISAIEVVNGDMTIGTMIAIQYIVGMLNGPLNQVVASIKQYQMSIISFKRLNEIELLPNEDKLDTHDMNPDTPKIEKKDIIMNNVSFRYHSEETECLKNISLYIKHGTTTAIVGASGSGKTTLMKLILGFYEPNIGIINIGEHDLSDISKDSWRKECGVVMQDGYIFSESVLQNIALGDNNPSLENAIYAAKIANVHNDIIKMPLEYNTIIGNDGKGLSLGQKQRILIARAIYKKPSYFFMDEATNSLDTTNERNIVEALSEHYNKATFVIIAHRLSTIRNADQIVVLENGQIVEIGNHNTLINKRDRYYQLIKNQL